MTSPASTPDPRPALRCLSLGAGIQSSAVLLLACEGVIPRFDVALFADTGWEPKAVYANLARLRAHAARFDIPVRVVSAGNIRDDALDPAHRFVSMPLHVLNPDGTRGLARRQCTGEYKIGPLKKAAREPLGYPHPRRVPRGLYVEQAIGISTDEFTRAKDSGVRYLRNVFPLIELGWDRARCAEYLAERGFEKTVKSACLGCPFHGNAGWRWIRDHDPDGWADAVSFDKAIRDGYPHATTQGQQLRGRYFLHLLCTNLSLGAPEKLSAFACGRARTDEPNSCVTESLSVEVGRPGRAGVRLGTFQHGVFEIRVAKVSAPEIRSPEVGALEVRSRQIGEVQVGVDEAGLLEVAPAKIGRLQVTAVQLCSLQPGAREVGVAELGVDKPAAVELQATKVHAGQVELRFVWKLLSGVLGWKPACQNTHGGLDIRRDYLQPRPFLDRCGWVFWTIRCAGVPRFMVADKGAEDELDCVAVRRGVPRNAFQGVDTTDADVEVVAADLVDRTGEALGDLPFAVDVDLSPGRRRANDDQQTGRHLQQGRADVVLQLGLGLLQLYAGIGSGNSSQVCLGQWRIEQLWHDHQAAHHDAQQAGDARYCAPHHSSCHGIRSSSAYPPLWNPPLEVKGSEIGGDGRKPQVDRRGVHRGGSLRLSSFAVQEGQSEVESFDLTSPSFSDRALATSKQAGFQFVEAGQHRRVDAEHGTADTGVLMGAGVP